MVLPDVSATLVITAAITTVAIMEIAAGTADRNHMPTTMVTRKSDTMVETDALAPVLTPIRLFTDHMPTAYTPATTTSNHMTPSPP